ncbi:alpha-N-acetylgalactosamine-specific lectin-like [Asterias rubens]|uniref:alpha-N-acetylgalactosamine-specific lectin-like n=1 Tax=Asterias rubens TaxID=7604 RepID=UPI001455C1CF|nr:alpha-N-acetylgalactosamine-specific lectin-like [Asterias rubens]
MMYSPTVTFKNMMFTRLAFLLLTTLLAASIHRATALNYCPPVWTQYQLPTGSFCYRLFGIRRTWQEAETTCQKYTICQGKETAHLVSVGSAEEEGFLNSYWKEMRGSFEGEKGIWLGYHKSTLNPGNHWIWTDKLKTTYENWDVSDLGQQSAVAEGVGCGQQVSTESDWPSWRQTDCNSKQHFVCKMHAM